MRPMTFTTVLAIAVALSAASAQTPPAPSQPPVVAPPASQVLTGNYAKLDFWQQVKLGSAYYTNPEALHDVRIVYTFDPKAFTGTGKSEQLYALARSGTIAFGIPDKQTSAVRVVPIGGLVHIHKIESSDEMRKIQDELTNLLNTFDISVVAQKDALLGSTATQALVWKSPQEPSATPIQ